MFDTPFQEVALRHAEAWRAHDGRRQIGSAATTYAGRDASTFSPKAAILFDASDAWTLKASIGRAVRTTVFLERSHDALYSQTNAGGTQVSNVGRIDTQGVEMALQLDRLFVPGLELSSSLTYADSEIRKNKGYPDTVGKRQPRVPAWRGTLLANYGFDGHWSGANGARFSGKQYGQLNNSDINGYSYQGFSRYFVTDVRVQYRIDRQWQASLGLDNLNNHQYWAFHPYPQRTVHAELRFDY